MTGTELLEVCEGGLLLIALVIGLFYLRADYEVDAFRQEMFKLRDEIFDYAASGHISFDHPAYVQLRDLANGLIRFAHRLTLWRILTMFALYRVLGIWESPTFGRDLEKNISSIGCAQVQSRMRDFHKQMSFFTVWQLVRSTIAFWPVIVFVFVKEMIGKARIVRSLVIKETVESPAGQTIPTAWIEEQAVACV